MENNEVEHTDDEDSSASYHDLSDHEEDESTDLSGDELEINNPEDIQIGLPEQYNPQDQDLVGDHLYLGAMEEVRGRILLDEDSIIEMPVVVQEGLICVPGQTLPLTISHPHIMAMMRRVIEGNHIFGILSFRPFEPHINNAKYKIGATAEIYEYGEEVEGLESGFGFRIKARIRQRIKVIQARRQIDGITIARVQILPELEVSDSLYQCRSYSLDKHRLSTATSSDISVASLLSKKRIYDKQYKIPFSVWPSWIHRSYDLQFIAQRVMLELSTSIFVGSSAFADVGSGSIVPRNPVDLSYWVIQNLPLDDELRLELLSINNPNQRLRAELSILQRCESLCCRECDYAIARQTDVFAMSKIGPQGVYVNPFGHVHETITVHRVDGLSVTTPPSTEFSWFPGYAWSIVNCSYCRSHIGWLFTANDRHLQPASFWGLSRQSLKPRLKVNDESEFIAVM
ncbi:hypothetical protein DAPPUDRAFT_112386 [Daphnia pulex]|uniref:Protein cereblon n=1 Tax=Daphnia pulex TaxID=6669 RepID=E9HBW1_DAPPU|nr:hypothetical protein DAPPUDRAFT_112386 [Daphnia pulex]|eukprot:EFX70803.1 hypothetical protein DAPPUDRAFT_112386 [Daphnia pulex]